jgi:hypothetical protein
MAIVMRIILNQLISLKKKFSIALEIVGKSAYVQEQGRMLLPKRCLVWWP